MRTKAAPSRLRRLRVAQLPAGAERPRPRRVQPRVVVRPLLTIVDVGLRCRCKARRSLSLADSLIRSVAGRPSLRTGPTTGNMRARMLRSIACSRAGHQVPRGLTTALAVWYNNTRDLCPLSDRSRTPVARSSRQLSSIDTAPRERPPAVSTTLPRCGRHMFLNSPRSTARNGQRQKNGGGQASGSASASPCPGGSAGARHRKLRSLPSIGNRGSGGDGSRTAAPIAPRQHQCSGGPAP